MVTVYNSTLNNPSERLKWEATATTSYTYNVWNHWMVTWSPSQGASLYINGALWAQALNAVGTSEYAKGPLNFGKLS